MDRVWKPNVEISPSCPRCGSSNTKFCYYNNYSLTQPRYFCKGCRRYWTKGGSLRNVPIGGGCRKTRRGNKSLRPSTNGGVVHSRSFDDLIINKHPYHHGLPECASQDQDSSGSSPIDIALVYSNFLNATPDSKASGFEIPELHGEFDQSIGLTTNVSSLNSEAIGLPEDEQGLVGCLNEAQLCDNDHFMYYSGLDSIPTHKQQDLAPLSLSTNYNPTINSSNNNGLPPLPGEDHLQEASHVMPWSDISQSLIDDFYTSQEPQHLETFDPDRLFFGDWSPFQFSR